MKLILASAGFSTPEIVNKCAELVGKSKDAVNIAVVNEAYAVEHGDHGWVLTDLNQIKNNFKGRMELVNLLALDLATVKKRIEMADVIFVVGGHTDYLMSVFHKTGFNKLLPELLKTKVYVGSSAGSMVLCNRVSTEAYAEIYGEENDYGISNYLGLVDFAIKPHLGNLLFPKNNPDKLLEVLKDYKGLVYGLADDSAILIDGSKTSFIGSKPVKVVDGHIVDKRAEL
jgi:dipeptidase E